MQKLESLGTHPAPVSPNPGARVQPVRISVVLYEGIDHLNYLRKFLIRAHYTERTLEHF